MKRYDRIVENNVAGTIKLQMTGYLIKIWHQSAKYDMILIKKFLLKWSLRCLIIPANVFAKLFMQKFKMFICIFHMWTTLGHAFNRLRVSCYFLATYYITRDIETRDRVQFTTLTLYEKTDKGDMVGVVLLVVLFGCVLFLALGYLVPVRF